MRRVMVTGATGFVGANLVRRLVGDGHEVHILVRPEYSGWRLDGLFDQLCLHEVDLARSDVVSGLLASIKPEWVFHLAAYGAYAHQKDVETMVLTNVLSTVNLVEAAIRAFAEVVVNTGSSSEYGFKNVAPTEMEPAEPNSAYAITKLSATLLCRELARKTNTRMATLRLYSVFGPFEEPTRLIPTLVTRALNGELPPLANPRTGRDFVYVDDVVDAYLLSADHSGTEKGVIYNVGTGVQTTISDLLDTVRELIPVAAEPRWGSYPDRAWDTETWVADSRRIQRELGWVPRNSVRGGLQQLIRWFGDHPEYTARYRTADSALES